MTTVYFIRHAKSDFSVVDERIRPLTPQGHETAQELVRIFRDISLEAIYSSPFLRTMDTVKPLAVDKTLNILPIEDFRERRNGGWVEDFFEYSTRQWSDFAYKLPEGESLAEVQQRNLAALHLVIDAHPNGSCAIGTHGTALSTIIHAFDPSFGYNGFLSILDWMPLVVEFHFDGANCRSYSIHRNPELSGPENFSNA